MHIDDITARMWNQLMRAATLESFLDRNAENFIQPSLPEYLSIKLAEYNILRSRVIEGANIEAAFGHQIFRGVRHPSRDKILQIALGFPLRVDEAQLALMMANKRCLNPRIRRDAIIIFHLNNRIPLPELQVKLSELKMPILGEDGD